ncbi:MAG TPA: Ig-like domain-containing protein, partial [Longimicrobiaceae bacterium]|nr:Ig-like domain-containing protein [Longimicrobiaceae bacterium]
MIRTLRSALGGAASAAVLVLFLALASCDSPSGPTPAGTTAHLEIIAGNGQTGVAGKELAAPLVVKVTDDKGKAVKGQVVNFRVVAGDGTVFGSTALTSADGLAQERWTLGTTARDTQKVEARAVDPATGTAIVFATFTAVATPDVPAALTKVVGDGQSAPVGAPLPDSLAVKLADRYGNAVAGQTVTFAVVSGGGSVSPASRSTDSAGVARAQWTLGTRLDSAQVASASFGSLPPVTFTA